MINLKEEGKDEQSTELRTLAALAPTIKHTWGEVTKCLGDCRVWGYVPVFCGQWSWPHRAYHPHSGAACKDFRAFGSLYILATAVNQIVNKEEQIIYAKSPRRIERRKQLFQIAFRKRLIKS